MTLDDIAREVYSKGVEVRFYMTGSGRTPVRDFIRGLPGRCQAATLDALEQIEKFGLPAPGVSCRQIAGKLWEIKIEAGAAVRVFYVLVTGPEAKPRMILLHAYLKGSQKTPEHDKHLALKRMKEVIG